MYGIHCHITELHLRHVIWLRRDVDSSRTNCDLTFTFLLHIHGLPIDAVRSSIVIILVSHSVIEHFLKNIVFSVQRT